MSDDYSPAYEDFVLRVNRFMDVVSAAEHLPTSEFLRRAGQAIADLHSGALDLPDVEPETDTNVAKSGGGSIYTSLRDKLGPFDDYWRCSILPRRMTQSMAVWQMTSRISTTT
jgi:hypothetical protein